MELYDELRDLYTHVISGPLSDQVTITTLTEQFVSILKHHNALFHFDFDPATEVAWDREEPTQMECWLMRAISELLYSDYLFQCASK